METFSALLAIYAGNSPVTGEFPAQRPVTLSFDVFFDLRLNKRLSKQSWGWLFETQSRPLWRHCNVAFWYPIRMLFGASITLKTHERYIISNHWQLDYLLKVNNRLTTKKMFQLRDRCERNLVNDGLRWQRASNAESVSISSQWSNERGSVSNH